MAVLSVAAAVDAGVPGDGDAGVDTVAGEDPAAGGVGVPVTSIGVLKKAYS